MNWTSKTLIWINYTTHRYFWCRSLGQRQCVPQMETTALVIDAIDYITACRSTGGRGRCTKNVSKTKDGLTVWEDISTQKLLKPVPRKVKEDGEEGELVFTPLDKERCRLFVTETPRRNKTAGRLGRVNCAEWIKLLVPQVMTWWCIRGVNVFPSPNEDLICKVDGLAPHYQIELT